MKNLKNIEPEEKVEKDKYKYPASEDIYYHADETNIDPEAFIETGIVKSKRNYKESVPHLPGDSLDVPGSSQDDEQEKIGSEDEENNYYSLGGDNHDD
jgi:hypothetical protein